MKKLITLFLALASVYSLMAQDSTKTAQPAPGPGPASATPQKRDWSKVNLSNRPNDHFMIQIGYNGWAQMPDTINLKGVPRSFNMYFMFDFPFKSNPRFSVGIGAGLGTDNVYFDKMTIDITGRNSNSLTFKNVADTNYFKKYKLLTTYVEAPIELRFAANPVNPNKSWKAAIGGKIGTMLAASAKGKNLLNKSGGTINSYIMKEKSKRYFNGTRLAVTGRISKGVLGIYGQYQINQFVKEGFGPDVRPFQIGISISGL
jgi:hypothetical protein